MATATPEHVRVEPLLDGLWRLEMSVEEAGLGSVCAYALADGDGLVLIDAGWSSPQTRAGTEAALAEIGFGLDQVQGVLLTHGHPDHYGLAGLLHERDDAWLALHEGDAQLLAFGRGDFDHYLEVWRGWLREVAGVPEEELDPQMEATVRIRRIFEVPAPDLVFADGWRAPTADWNLVAIHTPGHSPGHVCFREAERGLLFCGDHVLPDITPNISAGPTVGADPLNEYLTALERVRELPAEPALPGHGRPFTDLSGRVEEIGAHHEQRLAKVADLLSPGPATAWELTVRYGWARPIGEMSGLTRRSAVCEIAAHLIALRERGVVVSEGSVPLRWRRAEDAS